ncbi:unnamed protein product [Calypogeia fissa]
MSVQGFVVVPGVGERAERKRGGIREWGGGGWQPRRNEAELSEGLEQDAEYCRKGEAEARQGTQGGGGGEQRAFVIKSEGESTRQNRGSNEERKLEHVESE